MPRLGFTLVFERDPSDFGEFEPEGGDAIDDAVERGLVLQLGAQDRDPVADRDVEVLEHCAGPSAGFALERDLVSGRLQR